MVYHTLELQQIVEKTLLLIFLACNIFSLYFIIFLCSEIILTVFFCMPPLCHCSATTTIPPRSLLFMFYEPTCSLYRSCCCFNIHFENLQQLLYLCHLVLLYHFYYYSSYSVDRGDCPHFPANFGFTEKLF